MVAPELGTLEVTTTTSGPEPDADGYAVSIDGAAPAPLGANATFRQAGVAAGGHTVELSGLAANCTASGALRIGVSVTANSVASTTFAITCTPTTGSLLVTTSSTGTPGDPDGYQLVLDGVENQPIATSVTVTIPAVAPGIHTVALGGVAAGCLVDGDNPRSVTVAAGETAVVPIAVTCTPPPAESGTLALTTQTIGPEQDPDGYTFSIDGGATQPIGVNATVSVVNLAAGPHALQLAGASANCAVGGDNPRNVTVPDGGTVQVTYRVTCTATTGSLTITIAGLPAGANGAVTVTGPNAYSQQVAATRTLTGLPPGTYTVTAGDVTSGATKYSATPPSRTVNVTANGTASAAVTYAPATGGSLNLRIDGWQVTQSVQSSAGDVPLVANRDGYLRIFVLSNQENTVAPSVRVRLYRDGAVISTLTVPAPGRSTPTSRDEGTLTSSWNVKIPRALIGPGFAVLADVDPNNTIPEANETDNTFPASGTPQPQDVRGAPSLTIRFVPVKQAANGLQGDVSTSNKSSFLETVRRMYPLPGADGDAHAVYTTATSGALQADDANGAWSTVLSEVDALRVAEGTARTYYGVVRVNYASGLAGLGYLGRATAMGYDREPDKTRVVAHELGHTWNRLHTPCGNPSGVDPAYPYPGGVIGVYGVDMQNEILKVPSLPDIMGYCANPWISDYTYKAVQAFRAGEGAVADASAPAQRCLLIWGRIVDGRAVLEPAFEVVTRPSLPRRAGPYSIEGLASGGAQLFRLSFDAVVVADDPRGSRHFAFAVPLGDTATELGSLRLEGPVGAAAVTRVQAPRAAAQAQDIQARRVAGGAALHWDAVAHPMLMVRDPDTGEVLSFARGGDVDISTNKAELEVIASDRVGSQQVRIAVGR